MTPTALNVPDRRRHHGRYPFWRSALCGVPLAACFAGKTTRGGNESPVNMHRHRVHDTLPLARRQRRVQWAPQNGTPTPPATGSTARFVAPATRAACPVRPHRSTGRRLSRQPRTTGDGYPATTAAACPLTGRRRLLASAGAVRRWATPPLSRARRRARSRTPIPTNHPSAHGRTGQRENLLPPAIRERTNCLNRGYAPPPEDFDGDDRRRIRRTQAGCRRAAKRRKRSIITNGRNTRKQRGLCRGQNGAFWAGRWLYGPSVP